jgi:hypothetical protein
MIDHKLWDIDTEKDFFINALKNFASPEQLFYSLNSGYYAYVPKNCDSEGQTLQSRNSLIGQFTERWSKELFEPIARQLGLYAVNSVVCEEIGLPKRSSADLAFCTKNKVSQNPEDIKLIFEIKMSIVANYSFAEPSIIQYIGDYKTHIGNPALLRSDSMLKAIGKSINIRVSGIDSNRIPIIILGNSPITDSYIHKVDYLKTAGVIQGFWSVNPTPTDSSFIKKTPLLGFQTVDNYQELYKLTKEILSQDLNYFSSMISKPKLGNIIRLANKENTDEEKAERFLQLIREIQ